MTDFDFEQGLAELDRLEREHRQMIRDAYALLFEVLGFLALAIGVAWIMRQAWPL